MRLSHCFPIASSCICVTVHHDNRDFAILPNYQPHSSQSFHEQTLLFKKSTGVRTSLSALTPLLTWHNQLGWLSAFLKIYISVLQQASDLDDSVEEKLLVGDRPKPSNNPNCRLPWKDRLSTGSPEELDEVKTDCPSQTAISDPLCCSSLRMKCHSLIMPSQLPTG